MKYLSVCSGIEAHPINSYKPYQKSSVELPDGMHVKAKTRDIAGQRFGRLVAIKVVKKSSNNSLVWLCRCDCGTMVERTSAGLRKSKGVCSCGCYLKESSKEHLASRTPWNKGMTYALKKDSDEYTTRKAWSEAVRRIKGDKCERCGWAEARCDVHHIISRVDGGKNLISNGVVLCPNCHRIAHEQFNGGLKQ